MASMVQDKTKFNFLITNIPDLQNYSLFIIDKNNFNRGNVGLTRIGINNLC